MSPSSQSRKTPARRPTPRRPAAPAKRSKVPPRSKKPAKPAARAAAKPAPRPVPKSSPRPAAKGTARPSGKAAATPAPAAPPAAPRPGDSRRHVLSLSFLRDGDEFLARLETDGGQITELKNRALDQLLTLVAGELEDLLE